MIALLLALLLAKPAAPALHVFVRDGYVDPRTGQRYPLAPGAFMLSSDGTDYVFVSITLDAHTRPVLTVRPWNAGHLGAAVTVPLSQFHNHEVRN